jgi:predicted 3-demethylubiquinone-9 3-methyltransferase (glyoxalase superfamily)
MPGIRTHLWFDTNAEEAVNFYLSVFKNAKRLDSQTFTDTVNGADDVPLAQFEFEIEGMRLIALNAGPQEPFNPRMSLYVETRDQAETDYYWNALRAGGGREDQCGWLVDKFGVWWQVIPEALPRLLADKDKAKADRVLQAMYKMQKIIVADLEAVYAG